MIALCLLMIYAGFIFWLLTGILRIRTFAGGNTAGKFSVIIAAHNEEKNIGELLTILATQEYPLENVEVLLAADRCSDNTSEIASSFRDQIPNLKIIDIQTVPEGCSPKKHALATAISAASFDRLLFLDADVRPTLRHLATMDNYFAHGNNVVISLMRYPAPINLADAFLIFEKLVSWGIAAASTGHKKPIISYGGNWAYSRSAFSEAGGFGETMFSLSGDDDLLLQRFADNRQPVAICMNPDGWVETEAPASFKHFLRQRRRHFSAGKHYRPTVQAGYFVFHAVNLLLWISPLFVSAGFAVLLIKLGIDILLGTFLGQRFRISLSPWTIPIHSMLYMLYNTLVGPLGHLGKIRW